MSLHALSFLKCAGFCFVLSALCKRLIFIQICTLWFHFLLLLSLLLLHITVENISGRHAHDKNLDMKNIIFPTVCYDCYETYRGHTVFSCTLTGYSKMIWVQTQLLKMFGQKQWAQSGSCLLEMLIPAHRKGTDNSERPASACLQHDNLEQASGRASTGPAVITGAHGNYTGLCLRG